MPFTIVHSQLHLSDAVSKLICGQKATNCLIFQPEDLSSHSDLTSGITIIRLLVN